jgi:DNA-binding transcriptional ArsR family regulator
LPTKTQRVEAAWVAAWGEPTRLAIIRHLAIGEMTVTKLAVACEVEMMNISHHLGLLKDSGLVTAERDGRFMRYNLVGASVSGTTMTLTHSSGVKVVIPLG